MMSNLESIITWKDANTDIYAIERQIKELDKLRDETIKPQIRNKQKIIQSKNRKERKVIIEKVSDWDDVDWDEWNNIMLQ